MKLLSLALYVLVSVTSTHYTHDPYIDERTGRYDVDCSAFAQYLLDHTAPGTAKALEELVPDDRPRAKDFVRFFSGFEGEVRAVADIEPGDLIAWRRAADSASSDTGHVLVAAETPTLSHGIWRLPVVDSTKSGHGKNDPRRPQGPNGVGRGTIGLLADKHGAPIAFLWAVDGTAHAHYTEIRIGRPSPLGQEI